MEIRDPLSSELLSTLPRLSDGYWGTLSYSPDGSSLALVLDASLIIWDIQTGGVVKEVEWHHITNVQLVWSLDGGTIATISQPQSPDTLFELQGWNPHTNCTVHMYDIALGTTLSPVTLWSEYRPHLWAQDKSFQVMTTKTEGGACTIDISVVGVILIKIKSFCILSWGQYNLTGSFSSATSRICLPTTHQICVVDLWNGECSFRQEGDFDFHCFSPDGSLFATYQISGSIHIWKYTSGLYIPWREIQPQAGTFVCVSVSILQFSPTSLSIMGGPADTLQVWHLDGPPIITHPKNHMQLAVISCCGAYMATCQEGDSTITITNFHSQTPSQFINADTEVEVLALMCNVLSAMGCGVISAWQLTENGAVDGVFGYRWASQGDAIWTIPVSGSPWASVVDQIVIITEKSESEPGLIHAYHTGTGEVLEPTKIPKWSITQPYSFWAEVNEPYYLHCHKLKEGVPPKGDWPVSWNTLRRGWVKDPKGRYQLWIPTEWRVHLHGGTWIYKATSLQFHPPSGMVAIVF